MASGHPFSRWIDKLDLTPLQKATLLAETASGRARVGQRHAPDGETATDNEGLYYERLLSQLQESAARDPSCCYAHTSIAICYRQKARAQALPQVRMDLLRKARDEWTRASQLDPEAASELEHGNLLNDLGQLIMAMENPGAIPPELDEAEQEYKKYLRRFPRNPKALNALGTNYFVRTEFFARLGRRVEMEAVMRRSVRLFKAAILADPTRMPPYLHLMVQAKTAEDRGIQRIDVDVAEALARFRRGFYGFFAADSCDARKVLAIMQQGPEACLSASVSSGNTFVRTVCTALVFGVYRQDDSYVKWLGCTIQKRAAAAEAAVAWHKAASRVDADSLLHDRADREKRQLLACLDGIRGESLVASELRTLGLKLEWAKLRGQSAQIAKLHNALTAVARELLAAGAAAPDAARALCVRHMLECAKACGGDEESFGLAADLCAQMLELLKPWADRPDNEYNTITGLAYDVADLVHQELNLPELAWEYGQRAVEHLKAAREYSLLKNVLFNAGGGALQILRFYQLAPQLQPEGVWRVVTVAARARAYYKLSQTLCKLLGHEGSIDDSEATVSERKVLSALEPILALARDEEEGEKIDVDGLMRLEHERQMAWLSDRLHESDDPLQRALIAAGGEAGLRRTVQIVDVHLRSVAPLSAVLYRADSSMRRDIGDSMGYDYTVLLLENAAAENAGEVARALADRAARFYLDFGYRVSAVQAIDVAVKLAEKDDDLGRRCDVLEKAAIVYRGCGNPNMALDCCQKAITLLDDLATRIKTPEYESRFLSNHSGIFSVMQSALVDSMATASAEERRRLAGELLGICERLKGYLLKYMVGAGEEPRPTEEPGSAGQAAREEFARLVRKVASIEAAAALENQKTLGGALAPAGVLDSLKVREHAAAMARLGQIVMQRRLARKPPEGRPLSANVDVERTAGLLKEVLGLAECAKVYRKVLLVELVPSGTQLYAVGLTDGGAIDATTTPTTTAARKVVGEMPQTIVRFAGRRGVDEGRRFIEPCRVLADTYRELESRMGTTPEGDGDVLTIVVPHGWAAHLPWHALKASGSDEALGDRRPMVHLPTVDLLPTLLKRRRQVSLADRERRVAINLLPEPGGRGRAIADPRIASVVAELYRVLEKDGPDLGPDDATRAAVLESLAKATGGTAVLGFHGEFPPEDPFLAHLLINGEEILTADEMTGESRLALDLLVLVACKSALAVPQPGDDLLGFAQGCLVRAARSVVAGLYEIPAMHALVLARAFLHHHLTGKQDKAHALVSARKQLRDRPAELGLVDEEVTWARCAYYHAGLIVLGLP